MQKYFYLFLLLMGAVSAQAQIQIGCWDFEESCSEQSNAFLLNCIPNAIATSGRPGNASNTAGVNAVSGSRYASMYIRHCLNATRLHGDGIALQTNLVSGNRYRISFNYLHEGGLGPFGDNPIMGVHLVSDLPAFGGPGTCVANDLIPGIPQVSQTLGAVNRNSVASMTWQNKVYEFTANDNFNQVWFRPFLDLTELQSEFLSRFHIDNVCIEDITCTPDPFTLDVCVQSDGNVQVNIVGAEDIPQSQWRLFRLANCTPTAGTLWPPQTINWQDHNTITLPLNSGCYRLGYIFSQPGCSSKFVSQTLSTQKESIPICNPEPCIDWRIDVSDFSCDGITFTVLPDAPFPAGTIISSSVNDQGPSVNPGGVIQYFPLIDGDNRWVEVCFAVFQKDCPTVSKCEYIYVINCEGFTGGGSNDRNNGISLETDKQVLRFTNPADQFIRFSAPFAEGTAQLFSMQGSLVKTFNLEGVQQLDVSDVPDGQYTLSIQQADGRQAKLVLVMHRL